MDHTGVIFFEAEDYKKIVLEVILSGKHVSQPVSRLRLLLFIRAAIFYYSHNQHQCLEPFPSCFYDPSTKTRLYADLKTHILNIPPLETIQDSTTLPAMTWKLLYWIFTNPLDIKAISESESITYTVDLREKTKLKDIPYPRRTSSLFEINPAIPKTKFLAGKEEFGSFYAYHGSLSQNFHSIIHRGLISSLNVVSAFGHGTYLASDLNAVRRHVMTRLSIDNYPAGNLNELNTIHSTGKSYCIAIVEVVNDPSMKVVNINKYRKFRSDFDTKYFIVENDDFLQLRNLLIFEKEEIL